MKAFWIVGVCCLVQLSTCIPAVAKEKVTAKNAGGNPFYFEPSSSDGEPVPRPVGCGGDGKRNDSFFRDLGQSVSLTVIPAYDGAKLLSVNLIFKYWEKGELKISPEKFELQALPDEKIFTPTKLYRGALTMNSDGLFLEEVYLEFQMPPEKIKHISVVLPEGTVSGDRGVLNVAPIRFDQAAHSTGGVKPKTSRCMYSTEPPSRLEVARLRSIPPPSPAQTAKPGTLTGTWVVDVKAIEANMKAAPPPSKEEFFAAAGLMFLFIYEISDGVVNVSTNDGATKLTYRLVPEQSDKGKLVYKSENNQGTGDDFMTVSSVKGGNIKFMSSQNPMTSLVLFKRVKLDPNTKARDAGLAMEALQGFMNRLSNASNPSAKPDGAR